MAFIAKDGAMTKQVTIFKNEVDDVAFKQWFAKHVATNPNTMASYYGKIGRAEHAMELIMNAPAVGDKERRKMWVETICSMPVLIQPHVMDKILIWKMKGKEKQAMSQRTFHMEIRGELVDADKYETFKITWARLARQAAATLRLMGDSGVEPEIAIWSDDWFGNHQDISLLSNLDGQGDAAEKAMSETQEELVSSELLEAAQELAK